MLAQADALPPDEQMQLIAHLAERNRRAMAGDPAPRWSSLRGRAPDLLASEDAQAHVTRTRREADAVRAPLTRVSQG